MWIEAGHTGRFTFVLLVLAGVAYIGLKLNWRVTHVLVVQGLVYVMLATWLTWVAWLRTCAPL